LSLISLPVDLSLSSQQQAAGVVSQFKGLLVSCFTFDIRQRTYTAHAHGTRHTHRGTSAHGANPKPTQGLGDDVACAGQVWTPAAVAVCVGVFIS
jgi:hypothetical protein